MMKFVYGMKLYSRQAEKGPGRICRTTSMFGDALSGDIIRVQLKGRKVIDSVEREMLQDKQGQSATADVS